MYSNKYKITGIESGNIIALFWATHRQLQHIKKCSYLLVGKGRGVGGAPPPTWRYGEWQTQTLTVPFAHPRAEGRSATDRSAGQPLSGLPINTPAPPPLTHTAHASAAVAAKGACLLFSVKNVWSQLYFNGHMHTLTTVFVHEFYFNSFKIRVMVAFLLLLLLLLALILSTFVFRLPMDHPTPKPTHTALNGLGGGRKWSCISVSWSSGARRAFFQ